jgi:hypothetical protein
MIRMNALQVERMLKANPYDFYIHHYIGESTVHDSSGDELGTLSNIVFNRLLRKEKIIKYSESESFWSDGYFKIKV